MFLLYHKKIHLNTTWMERIKVMMRPYSSNSRHKKTTHDVEIILYWKLVRWRTENDMGDNIKMNVTEIECDEMQWWGVDYDRCRTKNLWEIPFRLPYLVQQPLPWSSQSQFPHSARCHSHTSAHLATWFLLHSTQHLPGSKIHIYINEAWWNWEEP